MTDAKKDYRDTVFLPQTAFPMQGGLPKKEPELLARWQRMDLHGKLRGQSAGREKFILHDGPPYANGNIHIGHALNKILKDVINRSRQMMGFDAPYVPGWDCHGLPIEWKIEEKYRAEGKDKDGVPILQFRAECRAFAEHWKTVQAEEFQRLGVVGDWAHPYSTMTKAAEAQILREMYKFVDNGLLYKGVKPVMWSVVEKTALAEAEIEYHDHTSTTLWVKFPVVKTACKELEGASVVIWTTTPWTIPANRAIAYGDFAYSVLRVEEVAEGGIAKVGDVLAVAENLQDAFVQEAKIGRVSKLAVLAKDDLGSVVCAHPFRGRAGSDGYFDYDVPLYFGDFVTTDAGTGFVHIAPGHGEDDFNLGRKHKIKFDETVGDDGRYLPNVKGFEGLYVYKPDGKVGEANGAVIKALLDAGALLAKKNIKHSYPHSWRSKAPLIFRTTPQWFIAMDEKIAATGKTLRETALESIGQTGWYPGIGENRIRGMIESRPDWCISRQRAWGVPIALFVDKTTGDVLRDKAVMNRIAAAFDADGADAWYARPAQEFLGNDYRADDFIQVFDIVDVWFESGSTHAFVLESGVWPNLQSPASLYLEGSDQHRGWFHSSLLESCGTRGRAPFDKVLTHGFTLDEQGRKMSKSLGNVTAPQEVNDKWGADILRLWVLSSDYSEDLRIGPEILKQNGDLYRRFRNTLRYLLGALNGMSDAEHVAVADMPELERWVLHRLHEVDASIRADMAAFDFGHMLQTLHNFCNTDLSAFYFDIRKDSLYCDRADSLRRRSARTVMEQIFNHLAVWLAPVLCFTAEEAWLARFGDDENNSVHLQTFPAVPAAWRDDALAHKWAEIRAVRRVVTGALERARNDKKIGAPLQAHPHVYVSDRVIVTLQDVDFAEICVNSSLTLQADPAPENAFSLPDIANVSVVVELAEGRKCERCWQVLPEVGSHKDAPDLCHRCHDAVTHSGQAAA
ncbi:MAG: isoleucine--tRNA ligase [Alphaproteobacteria bacterium]|nr:isoleucine--tRNA ligase [Alphaproteobacteria bacterium]